jgi:hypothetical protein
VPSTAADSVPRVRTRAIDPGDLVLVDRRGRLFYARVLGAERAGVPSVQPLDRRMTYRSARAREIVDHWSHNRADRDERPPAAQLQLGAIT